MHGPHDAVDRGQWERVAALIQAKDDPLGGFTEMRCRCFSERHVDASGVESLKIIALHNDTVNSLRLRPRV